MNVFKQRLARLEMMEPITTARFMGTLNVPPGQRPLDALLGAEPGIWLLTTPALDGGLLGRVSHSGRREIMFADRAS